MATVQLREGRVHPRFALAASIEVTTPAGLQQAVLEDLSLGGARFRAESPPGTWGDPADLWVPSLFGVGDLCLKGVIVRTERRPDCYSVAVRFEALPLQTRERLQTLTHSIPSSGAPPAP